MFQPAPGEVYREPDISIDGTKLNAVTKFTYLGSTLSNSVAIDDEADARIAKASSAFGRLKDKVWERRGIRVETKLKVYSAVVLPSLLYGCETWTVYSRHVKKLNHFHLTCLRKIMKIRWEDKVPDTEVLAKADTVSIHTLLAKARLRWAGHVVRMSDVRLPKKLFYSELHEGKRSVGCPKKRFKDGIKATLKDFDIDPACWEESAKDRGMWRSLVRKGAAIYEERRISEAKQKRQNRKERDKTRQQHQPNLKCPNCDRLFYARIGLISHIRTHR